MVDGLLKSNRARLQRMIAGRLNLKRMPKIEFRLSHDHLKQEQIDDLFDEIKTREGW